MVGASVRLIVSNLWSDHRSYLSYLEDSGELVRVTKEVDTKFEIAAYDRKSCDISGPAFLFTQVKDYPRWQYSTALYASRKRIANALGAKQESEILSRYRNAVMNPIAPKIVKSGACKEVVLTGDKVDLGKLPLAVHSELDSGRYITSAVEVAKDIETGVRLLGIHRLEMKSKDTLTFWGSAEKRIGRGFLKAQEKGNALDIAITLGNDPTVDLASQAKVSHDVDKFGIAGALKGSPIELVPCETIGLEVPRNAEIVIEGKLIPNSQVGEGPFGEVTGCYSGKTMSPQIKISAITMRQDPIMHTVIAGFPPSENSNMAMPAQVEAIYRLARLACPEIRAVNMAGTFTVLVSMKKRHEGEPLNVISSIFGNFYHSKFCYVFDEDIDIFDRNDVDWATRTRMQPHKNAHIFPVMVGAPLDPSSPIPRHTSKLGFDCTIPLNADRSKYAKVVVPGADKVTW